METTASKHLKQVFQFDARAETNNDILDDIKTQIALKNEVSNAYQKQIKTFYLSTAYLLYLHCFIRLKIFTLSSFKLGLSSQDKSYFTSDHISMYFLIFTYAFGSL